MITDNLSALTHPIRESKIIHKRSKQHPLARFITEEAVALKFNVKIEDIHRIELWDKLVYVYAGKLSRFVSYADFPPLVTEKKPTEFPVAYWSERLRKLQTPPNQTKKQALLTWWTLFYQDRFCQCINLRQLKQWGEVVAILKPSLPDPIIETLREFYRSCQSQLLPVNSSLPHLQVS
jgi:hypothetical protein